MLVGTLADVEANNKESSGEDALLEEALGVLLVNNSALEENALEVFPE